MRHAAVSACVAGVLVFGLVVAGPAFGEEPGDLFPNVKAYDETVPAPVSKPDREAAKPPAQSPPQVQLPAPSGPPVAPSHPGATRPAQTAPPAPPIKPAAPELWAPYRQRLLGPLMSPESQARFDKEFMPRVIAALRGKTTKQDADTLWKEAHEPSIPADLRRALMLHVLGVTIEDGATLDLRAARAREALPLLTEETLPVAQARADAITQLAFGALATASDDLLSLVVESQCKLARMQVQAGFPLEAQTSMSAARDAYRYLHNRTDEDRDTLAEAGAWLDRASGALAVSPRYMQILAAKPDDPFANTQIALLNLSLYGDVRQAARAALHSDRIPLQALAAAVGKAVPTLQSGPPDAAGALSICTTLLDVAESGIGQTFDHYSIGTLVAARLADLTATGALSPVQSERLHALESRAVLLVAQSGLKPPPFHTLAALIGGGNATQPAATKLVLFAKDNGTVVKYVKPTSREEAEALGIERQYLQDLCRKIDCKPVECETAHCLIFTDLPANQYAYLKSLVEAAYAAAAREYDFPLNENVFAAKLPVIFLADSAEFAAFAKADGNESGGESVGYFHVEDSGVGFITVRHLSAAEAAREGRDAKNIAESTTVWNMTGIFSLRYRTNRVLPAWLTTGMADHVAAQFYPHPERIAAARRFSTDGKSVESVLTKQDFNFDDQSVALTLVSMLMAKDRNAFKQLIDKIKDGADPEAALKETFKWSYADLNQAWQAWAPRNLSVGQ